MDSIVTIKHVVTVNGLLFSFEYSDIRNYPKCHVVTDKRLLDIDVLKIKRASYHKPFILDHRKD